jgi:hypothetical protein
MLRVSMTAVPIRIGMTGRRVRTSAIEIAFFAVATKWRDRADATKEKILTTGEGSSPTAHEATGRVTS